MEYENLEAKWENVISKARESHDGGGNVYSNSELLEEFMATLKAFDGMHEALMLTLKNLDDGFANKNLSIKTMISEALAKAEEKE